MTISSIIIVETEEGDKGVYLKSFKPVCSFTFLSFAGEIMGFESESSSVAWLALIF